MNQERVQTPTLHQIQIRLAAPVVAATVFWLLVAAVVEAKPPPPAQRTYFTIFLGLGGGFDTSASCMKFRRTRVCDLEGDVCGSWELGETDDKQSEFSFHSELIDEGEEIVLDGTGRVDNRSRKSSIGGAARVSIGGQTGNFALGGREAGKAKCRRLVDQFNSRAMAANGAP